jgi:hypothetical protein
VLLLTFTAKAVVFSSFWSIFLFLQTAYRPTVHHQHASVFDRYACCSLQQCTQLGTSTVVTDVSAIITMIFLFYGTDIVLGLTSRLCLSVCLYLSICMSICLSVAVCLSVYISACLPACLPVWRRVFLYLVCMLNRHLWSARSLCFIWKSNKHRCQIANC